MDEPNGIVPFLPHPDHVWVSTWNPQQLVGVGEIVVQVASYCRGMVSLSFAAAVAVARRGADLCSNLHHRIREEALRLQVARMGEDLLAELMPLLTRCQVLLEVVQEGAPDHQLSASDQRCLVEGLDAHQARVQMLERQVRRALLDLVALRGRALEDHSNLLSNLDVEICLLASEIEDCEALCRTLWANTGAAAFPLVA